MTVLNLVIKNVIAPASTRIGTLAAGYLASIGVNADYSAQVGIGVTALGLIIGDLFLAHMRKRSIENKAISGFVNRNL